MTTTLSRQPTGQSSISMVVAGQPNTAVGRAQDEEAHYLTLSNPGILPTNLNRTIGYWGNSFRERGNPQKIGDFSVPRSEHEQLLAQYFEIALEHSSQRDSLGDVQPTGSEDYQWMVGEYFRRPFANQQPRVGARSVDGDVYQWSPSFFNARISFAGMMRALGEAHRRQASPEKQEPALNSGAWVASKPLYDYSVFLGAVLGDSDAYSKRIETLRGLAADEEITVNEASVEDFRYFVSSVVPAQNAQLVIMDNGNLRAVWKNEEGSHLGLQFLGGHLVQYVVFRRGGSEGKVYRLAGESSFDEMRKSIWDWGLSSLMSA